MAKFVENAASQVSTGLAAAMVTICVPQQPILRLLTDSPRRSQLRAAFEKLDKDNDGYLTQEELVQGVSSDPEIKKLFLKVRVMSKVCVIVVAWFPHLRAVGSTQRQTRCCVLAMVK